MIRQVGIVLALAATLTATDPKAAGVDLRRLNTIGERMQSYIDAGKVSGVVTLASRNGEVIHTSASGMVNVEDKTPMRADAIFQLMSMTKPFTAVAIMMLVEEGRLSLYDDVALHLPEFKGVKSSRPICIYDLLTHTSGMRNLPGGAMKTLPFKMDHTLAEAVTAYAKESLEFEPGTRVLYSNPGIATLGRIVEVVSGQPYEKFIETRILKPLGMNDTFFYPPSDKLSRIALVYTHRGGKLVRLGPESLGGDPALYRRGARYPAPEFGLFSTAADLSRFYQMMLNRGEWKGARVLSPASVDVMTAAQTDGLPRDSGRPGRDFGLSWEIVTKPVGTLALVPIGSYGHGGAYGTQVWIEPSRGLVLIFLIASDDGQEYSPRDAFLQIVNSSILR